MKIGTGQETKEPTEATCGQQRTDSYRSSRTRTSGGPCCACCHCCKDTGRSGCRTSTARQNQERQRETSSALQGRWLRRREVRGWWQGEDLAVRAFGWLR